MSSNRIKGTMVYGDGPIPCDIMIIGEAPGADEDEQGKPFVGKSGTILNIALELADLPRESVYITNMYKLRPPGNRTPTDEELDAHRPILNQELEEVMPKYIMLLGGTALWGFAGIKGITANRGRKLFPYSYPKIYSTFHPAATIYNKETMNDFLTDFTVFGKIARGVYTQEVKSSD